MDFSVQADLTAEATAGAIFTAGAWDQYTQLTLSQVAPQAELHYAQYNQPSNPSRAGEVFQNVQNCTMISAKATINQTHFGPVGQGPVTVQEKGCIFAHEAGHALGLAHSNIASHHDSPDPPHPASVTIMRGNEHVSRCHVPTPPGIPKTADRTEINGYY